MTAPTRVTIPADLAADVQARPEAYRPPVAIDEEVLGILPNGIGIPGRVAAVEEPEWVGVEYDEGGGRAHAAWALVGSVDGGPRPAVGQRVLVLECCQDYERHVGLVGTAGAESSGAVDVVSTTNDDVGCLATRWALLPDPAEPARLLPCSCSPMERCTSCQARGTRPPPGALPASQLYTPPSAAEQDEMRAGIRAARASERRADAVDAIVCWLADVDDPLDAPERLRDLTGSLVDAMNASLAATDRLPFLSTTDPDATRAERDGYAADVVRLHSERNEAQAERDRLRAALDDIAKLTNLDDTYGWDTLYAAVFSAHKAARAALDGAP